MNRSFSLRGRDHFRSLARQGKRWSHAHIQIRYQLDHVNPPKFAVSVSRACGNAVQRNRLRRLWVEALRTVAASVPSGYYQLRPIPGPPLTIQEARSVVNSFLGALEG